MLKRYFIFIFLATAYFVVFAHDVTPHKHSQQKAGHAHHHEHDDNNDKENNNNTFYYFQHIGESGLEYCLSQPIKNEVQKKRYENTFIDMPRIISKHFEKPPLIVFIAPADHICILQTLAYFFPIKAPPAYLA
jgi:Tat protein secretion system quality control protein TatD with DNase activity